MPVTKNNSHRNRPRVIKHPIANAAKPARSPRSRMKNQVNTKVPSKLEQGYSRLFTSPQTPQQNFYADDYSLAQPSVLKYVPSTTSPNAEE